MYPLNSWADVYRKYVTILFDVFQGKRMNYGATVDDYIISIGQELGQDMQLHDNLLAFTPPETQPEPHEHRGLRGYPDVLVNLAVIPSLLVCYVVTLFLFYR